MFVDKKEVARGSPNHLFPALRYACPELLTRLFYTLLMTGDNFDTEKWHLSPRLHDRGTVLLLSSVVPNNLPFSALCSDTADITCKNLL